MASPSKRRRVTEEKRESVCSQALQLPDLLNVSIHHQIGKPPVHRCLVEVLAENPCLEKKEIMDEWGVLEPMWEIGQYTLTANHFTANAAANSDYSWTPYLNVAIQAFNCHVNQYEDYSHCFPINFFDLTQKAKEKQFTAAFEKKAAYHSSIESFTVDYWQASWRILLPVQKNNTLIDVVFVTNQVEEGYWVCTIDSLCGDIAAWYLEETRKVLAFHTKEFEVVGEKGAPKNRLRANTVAMDAEDVVAGRLVALLLKCKSPLMFNAALALSLLEQLKTWIYNAVYSCNPNIRGWVGCEIEGCPTWMISPRGSLGHWAKGAKDETFTCHTLGKTCTFGNDSMPQTEAARAPTQDKPMAARGSELALAEARKEIQTLKNDFTTAASTYKETIAKHSKEIKELNEREKNKDIVSFKDGGIQNYTEAKERCPTCGDEITFKPDIPTFNAFEQLQISNTVPRGQQVRSITKIKEHHGTCNLWWACLDKKYEMVVVPTSPGIKKRSNNTKRYVTDYLAMRMAKRCKEGCFTKGEGRDLEKYSSAAFIDQRISHFFTFVRKGESDISLVNPRTQLQHTLTYTIARRYYE
jgi:hypothetical protein